MWIGRFIISFVASTLIVIIFGAWSYWQWDSELWYDLSMTLILIALLCGLSVFNVITGLAYLLAVRKPPALVLWSWGFEYRLDQCVARRGRIAWSEVTTITSQTYGWRSFPILACGLRDPENVNASAKPLDMWWSASKNSRRTRGVMVNLLAFSVQDRQAIAYWMWQLFVAYYQQNPQMAAPRYPGMPQNYSDPSIASPI